MGKKSLCFALYSRNRIRGSWRKDKAIDFLKKAYAERSLEISWQSFLCRVVGALSLCLLVSTPIDILYERSLVSYRHSIGGWPWTEIRQIFCRENFSCDWTRAEGHPGGLVKCGHESGSRSVICSASNRSNLIWAPKSAATSMP